MEHLAYGDVEAWDPQTQIPASVRPTLDVWMRDPQVCVGRDGWYYLTGTTRPPRKPPGGPQCWGDGIRLWRSRDLRSWEPLGLVWSLDRDATWQRHFRVYWPHGARIVAPEDFHANPPPPDVAVHRGLWAPELHYLRSRDTYALVASVSYNMGIPESQRIPGDIFGGTFLLLSASGEPTGPWEEPAAAPLTDLIDPCLFEDDDGAVYLLVLNSFLFRLRDDLRGLSEPPERLRELRCSPDGSQVVRYASVWDVPRLEQTPYDPEPMSEGGFLFKSHGRYHLCLSMRPRVDGAVATYRHREPLGPQNRGPYNVVVASAEHIRGPYGPRYTALTHGGHGNFFADREGRWWACVFCPPCEDLPAKPAFCCQPALVPMKWEDCRIMPDGQRTQEAGTP